MYLAQNLKLGHCIIHKNEKYRIYFSDYKKNDPNTKVLSCENIIDNSTIALRVNLLNNEMQYCGNAYIAIFFIDNVNFRLFGGFYGKNAYDVKFRIYSHIRKNYPKKYDMNQFGIYDIANQKILWYDSKITKKYKKGEKLCGNNLDCIYKIKKSNILLNVNFNVICDECKNYAMTHNFKFIHDDYEDDNITQSETDSGLDFN